jgi:glycosyltransferase involved in cell wall biosynthesis
VPAVTVLLPCLNEAQSLGACIESARTGLTIADLAGEVLVVDNGSTDGSGSIAHDHGGRVVSAPTPGYGSALQVGIEEARGDIVVMADADGTYDLTRLGELVQPIIDEEADLVLGSRLEGANRGTMPLLHRLVGTPLISFLLRRVAGGIRIRDSQSGYRAFRTTKMQALGLKATGMEFASEMLIRAANEGFRIRETPIGYRPRTGESKLRTMTDGRGSRSSSLRFCSFSEPRLHSPEPYSPITPHCLDPRRPTASSS